MSMDDQFLSYMGKKWVTKSLKIKIVFILDALLKSDLIRPQENVSSLAFSVAPFRWIRIHGIQSPKSWGSFWVEGWQVSHCFSWTSYPNLARSKASSLSNCARSILLSWKTISSPKNYYRKFWEKCLATFHKDFIL